MYIAHNLFYFLPLFSLSYYSHFFFLFLRYVQTIRSEVDEFLFSISSCGKSTVALRAHFLLYSWRFTGLASWQCGMMIHQLHMPRLPEKFNDLKFLMCFLSFLAQKAVDWQIQLGYRPCARYLFFFCCWLWAGCFSKDCYQLLKSSRLQAEWSFFGKKFSFSKRGRKADIYNTSTTHLFSSLSAGAKIVF